MKKSEMLKIIEDAIWKGGGCIDNIQPDNLESAARRVLEDIQKAGMRPPEVIHEVKCTARTAGTFRYNVSEWED